MTTLTAPPRFLPRLEVRRRRGRVFAWICAATSVVAVILLSVLLIRVFAAGWSMISWNFLNAFPEPLEPELGGVKAALWGTIWLITITAVVSVPVGIGGAIFLEEYGKRNRLARFIEVNIANLAGVPSVVYGILGLAVFIRGMHLGRSVLAGALSMSLLILPTVIIAAREALRAVPQTMRQASLALGATQWQTIRHHVLPAAMPGMMTGIILALSRAIGEAAPLIMIGAVMYIAYVPEGPLSSFTAMPLLIYEWTMMPDPVYANLAAAAIIVLLGVLLPMNAIAVVIRALRQRSR